MLLKGSQTLNGVFRVNADEMHVSKIVFLILSGVMQILVLEIFFFKYHNIKDEDQKS